MFILWLYQDSISFHWGVLALLVMMFVALLLDAYLGEPKKFHPLVGFGLWAKFIEKRMNNMPGKAGYLGGVFAVLLTLSPIILIVMCLYWVSGTSIVSACILQVLILYLCLGWQSLQEHVSDVWQSLVIDDLGMAQDKLGLIVSRDTKLLSADEVAQADIESVLENSSDALFATLFWFLIGGATFALFHRWVNTLDAMWGYKNSRFYYFGWAAARLDDVLAWVPARLTAFCFVWVAGEHRDRALECWQTQAKHCDSPNGGVVMTTGAGAINVKLSAKASYDGVLKQKPRMGAGAFATTKDIPQAITLVRHALGLFMAMTTVLVVFIYYIGAVL